VNAPGGNQLTYLSRGQLKNLAGLTSGERVYLVFAYGAMGTESGAGHFDCSAANRSNRHLDFLFRNGSFLLESCYTLAH
jgi:hypothetical protein